MRELRFLIALWKASLLSAMEYRVAFISQVVGMALNDAVYFIFWIIWISRSRRSAYSARSCFNVPLACIAAASKNTRICSLAPA